MNQKTPTKYWRAYSGLQRIKHRLIKEYLNGWFPKLGYWSGRIVYFDTHAGRGKHATGDLGSPLIALYTFLKHKHCSEILKSSEVVFCFIERDEENFNLLCQEIENVGKLPKGIKVHPLHGDCEEQLAELLAGLKKRNASLAPAFFFVDPFGFSLPMHLLRQIIRFPRVELLINVMWRYIDLAICQKGKNPGMKKRLDAFFGSKRWINISSINGSEHRANAAIELLAGTFRTRWPTYVKMQAKGRTQYILLHLTNHDAGRDLAKECFWKVCSAVDLRSFIGVARDPDQRLLLQPDPDFRSLEKWLRAKLSQRPWRWNDLECKVRRTLWLPKHAKSILREWRKQGVVIAEGYQERFAFEKNPRFRFSSD